MDGPKGKKVPSARLEPKKSPRGVVRSGISSPWDWWYQRSAAVKLPDRTQGSLWPSQIPDKTGISCKSQVPPREKFQTKSQIPDVDPSENHQKGTHQNTFINKAKETSPNDSWPSEREPTSLAEGPSAKGVLILADIRICYGCAGWRQGNKKNKKKTRFCRVPPCLTHSPPCMNLLWEMTIRSPGPCLAAALSSVLKVMASCLPPSMRGLFLLRRLQSTPRPLKILTGHGQSNSIVSYGPWVDE